MRRHEIDLQSEASGGRIEIVEMEAAEIGSVAARFSSEFRERLDAGEMEGLAYLIASMETDLRFVSADGPAIQAVAMLDPDLRVISLEEVLDLCGFTKPLASQFTRDFVRRNVREGTTRRIQGRGMV